ncbi:Rv3235 family protein [Ruania suaedae]|uniref:Rv3235 family protein n=1 Tax=Ruania suaedae TaxID=2897774 RepID=UPI001E47AA1E|nr:Rv3235 family protein [Ruania suaedae]UFU02174.1 Rv3235 family protein [Ruania suaedae]
MSIAPQALTARPAPAGTSTQRRSGWDRLRFDAAAEAAGGEDEAPVPARPRLVWSHGRATERADPDQWAGVLVRACAESLLGMRPPAQLGRWLDPAVWTALKRRSALALDLHGRPRSPRPITVRRVIGAVVSEGAWEGSVVLDDGVRVRGAAVRLEEHRGRWRGTAVRIG